MRKAGSVGIRRRRPQVTLPTSVRVEPPVERPSSKCSGHVG